MSYYTGSGTIMQFAKEQSFKTAADATTLINHTSESINVSVTKQDDGSLYSSKVQSLKELLAVTIDGSISFVLKPEFAGLLFFLTLGGEDTVTDNTDGTFSHLITLCSANESLPSLTLYLDKKVSVKKYPGITVSALSLDCAASDYVKGSIDIKGTEELTGTINSSVTTFSLPSFRCVNAVLKLAGAIFDVTSTSLKVDNALEDIPKTYGVGLYNGKPIHGKRSITADLEIPYSSNIESLKDNYLLTDDTASLELTLTTRDPSYKIVITIPNIMITSVSANVSGTGLLTSSVSLEAIEKDNTEPLTVLIQDKTEASYSA